MADMGNVKSLSGWWVTDLVGRVAHEDRHDIRAELGYPSVANGFKRTTGESVDALDVGDYSSTEVKAMAQAIEWLRVENRAYYDVVRAYMRMPVEGHFDLYPALVLLGQKVDEIVGG